MRYRTLALCFRVTLPAEAIDLRWPSWVTFPDGFFLLDQTVRCRAFYRSTQLVIYDNVLRVCCSDNGESYLLHGNQLFPCRLTRHFGARPSSGCLPNANGEPEQKRSYSDYLTGMVPY